MWWKMNNYSVRKSKATGPILLLIAQYITKIMGPLISLLVVRYLGTEDYGLYASAIAVTSFLLFLPDFGLQQSALRLSVDSKIRFTDLIRVTLNTSILYAVITLLILYSWLKLFDYDFSIQVIALISGIGFFRTSLTMVVTTFLQVKQEYSRIAVWNLLINSIQWIIVVLCIIFKLSVYHIVLWPNLISLFVAILMIIWEGNRAHIFLRKTSLKGKRLYKNIIGQSLEFGTAGSMHTLYHRSDGAILSAFRNPVEVGYYSVAYKVTDLINFLPGVLFNQVLYPKYFEWSKTNRVKYLNYYLLMNKLMVIFGLFATSVILLFSKEIIKIIFGSDDLISVNLLNIMMIAVPFRFLASSVGAILTTDNLIRKKIKIQTLIAIVNVGSNLFFIPIYGATVAALLMVITDVLLFLGYLIITNKFVTKYHFNRKMFFPILIMIGMVILVYYFMELFIIYKLIILFILSIISLFTLFISLEKEEIKGIKTLLLKK